MVHTLDGMKTAGPGLRRIGILGVLILLLSLSAMAQDVTAQQSQSLKLSLQKHWSWLKNKISIYGIRVPMNKSPGPSIVKAMPFSFRVYPWKSLRYRPTTRLMYLDLN